MSAKIIDGKALAAVVRNEVKTRVDALAEKGVVPGLAVVLVGEDPASQVYVRSKERAAEKVGVQAFDHRLPSSTTQADLLGLVKTFNEDPKIHGILVQLPLPAHIDDKVILDAILPSKDVDGFHAENLGLLAQGRPRFVAATPSGCMRLLEEAGVELSGARAVVVGRSNIVGKPMAMLLTNANATVTLCHSRTKDLPARVAEADVVVAAVGKIDAVKADWLKPGAAVIDVGINRNAEGKLQGDVEFDAALERASAITPVPGGVGPMTIASLLANTVLSAELASQG
jgi:methylenetetrahydrofolate dehydrogenase (NADP+)/methenyltetrahydrofolate cyclohydrolase